MTTDNLFKLKQCIAAAAHQLDRLSVGINEVCALSNVGMMSQSKLLDLARIAQSNLETAKTYLVGEKGEDTL